MTNPPHTTEEGKTRWVERRMVAIEILEPLNWKGRLGYFLHRLGVKIFESSVSYKIKK